MDIRELRIGDKVTYLGRIVTIRAIYETGHVEFLMRDGDHVIEFTVNSKEIEPIPLTDDMLCSIGIIPYMRANASTYYAIKDYCLLDYISNMGYYTFTAEAGKQHIRTSKHIYYLHQLQHEMFDAGIEFKIEL